MSLDLHKIALQIDNVASRIQQKEFDRLLNLESTLSLFNGASPSELEIKRANSNIGFLVPRILESMSSSYPCQDTPKDYTVLAADGSHIDVDRHLAMQCYLINIGTVLIKYGENPGASLTNDPQLHTNENGLKITDEHSSRHQDIEGPLLGILRTIEEMKAIIKLVEEADKSKPILALVDGTLILWGIIGQAYPGFVRKALLENGIIDTFNQLRDLSRTRKLALAAYVSLPRSTEIVNLLRIDPAVCPYEEANCEANCGSLSFGSRPCDSLTGILDRDIFSNILAEGERSDIFASTIDLHYGEHAVYFYYLNTGSEIARIEIPKWVANDQELLAMTHSLALDQSNLGHGYPVAISEAHEQAVLTMGDREEFRSLVERYLGNKNLPVYTSLKNQSKKLKWL
jgi:hypothetical protein